MDANQTPKQPKRKQQYILPIADLQETIMQQQAEKGHTMREKAETMKRALNLKQDAIFLFI